MALNLSTLSSTGTEGTPQGAGDRYTSIAAWESAAQAVHGADDQSVLQCYKGTTTTAAWQADGSLNEQLVLDGWTISAVGDILIEAAPGNEHGGLINGGFVLWTSGSSTITFELRQNGSHIKGIEFQKRGTNSTADNVRSYGDDLIVEQCIFSINEPLLDCTAFYFGTTDDSIFKSNLFYSESNTKITTVLDTRANRTQLIGNTWITTTGGAVFSTTAISQVDVDLVGNVFRGDFATGDTWDSVNHTQSNNGFYGAGSFGIAPYVITDNDFEDYNNKDFRAKAGGAMEDAGIAWSGFTTDINGNPRNDPPEGGAYEITGGAAPVSFDGPDIVAQTGTENVLFSFNENGGGTVASRFTGAVSYAYAPGSDQPPGLTVNATTGNLEGTPTSQGTYNVTIEGSD